MYPSLGTPNLEQSCFRLQNPPLYKFLRMPLITAYFQATTSWVFFKQEAWPCHVCPQATKVYKAFGQFPPTSEIEWLCVDVDCYEIVNIYKPPPTRLRSLDLPMLPHPYLYAGDFNCRHFDWVTMITVRTMSVWLAGQVLIVLPSYTTPRTPPVFTPTAGTLVPIQI